MLTKHEIEIFTCSSSAEIRFKEYINFNLLKYKVNFKNFKGFKSKNKTLWSPPSKLLPSKRRGGRRPSPPFMFNCEIWRSVGGLIPPPQLSVWNLESNCGGGFPPHSSLKLWEQLRRGGVTPSIQPKYSPGPSSVSVSVRCDRIDANDPGFSIPFNIRYFPNNISYFPINIRYFPINIR